MLPELPCWSATGARGDAWEEGENHEELVERPHILRERDLVGPRGPGSWEVHRSEESRGPCNGISGLVPSESLHRFQCHRIEEADSQCVSLGGPAHRPPDDETVLPNVEAVAHEPHRQVDRSADGRRALRDKHLRPHDLRVAPPNEPLPAGTLHRLILGPKPGVRRPGCGLQDGPEAFRFLLRGLQLRLPAAGNAALIQRASVSVRLDDNPVLARSGDGWMFVRWKPTQKCRARTPDGIRNPSAGPEC